MEKTKTEIYLDNYVAAFVLGQQQVELTRQTLSEWLYVMPPLTNKSPSDQVFRSKVQRL